MLVFWPAYSVSRLERAKTKSGGASREFSNWSAPGILADLYDQGNELDPCDPRDPCDPESEVGVADEIRLKRVLSHSAGKPCQPAGRHLPSVHQRPQQRRPSLHTSLHAPRALYLFDPAAGIQMVRTILPIVSREASARIAAGASSSLQLLVTAGRIRPSS